MQVDTSNPGEPDSGFPSRRMVDWYRIILVFRACVEFLHMSGILDGREIDEYRSRIVKGLRELLSACVAIQYEGASATEGRCKAERIAQMISDFRPDDLLSQLLVARTLRNPPADHHFDLIEKVHATLAHEPPPASKVEVVVSIVDSALLHHRDYLSILAPGLLRKFEAMKEFYKSRAE
jgi:hypothetical protein